MDLFKQQLVRGDLLKTGNVREIQPLNGHEPFIVSTHRNILDVNIIDKMTIVSEHGDIKIDYVNFNGELADAQPQPNGLLKISYEDFLKRTIEIVSDGICHNIKFCGFKGL